MKTPRRERIEDLTSRLGSTRGILLMDCLVYLGLFSLVGTLAFASFFHAHDNSKHLMRNAADIVRALNVGEKWRADIRAATSPPRLIKSEQEPVLLLSQSNGEVRYLFRDAAVYRQGVADSKPLLVLAAVKSSLMTADVRTQITAWRWEIELATKQETARVTPLFTFIAVPKGQQAP